MRSFHLLIFLTILLWNAAFVTSQPTVPTTPIPPAIAPESASTILPTIAGVLCNVCGDDPSATMSNRDSLVDLSFLGYDRELCAEVFDAGLEGVFLPDECDLLISNIPFQTTCGCSNLNTPTAPTPMSPASAPIGAPVSDRVSYFGNENHLCLSLCFL
jgi:hypothetical protein